MAKNEKEKNVYLISEGKETRITINASGQFSIKIESNPSTGYGWDLLAPKENEESPLKLIKKTILEPGAESQNTPLGAPTYMIFTFEAVTPGDTIITLQYRRPWEKDVPPIKTQKIFVTITQ